MKQVIFITAALGLVIAIMLQPANAEESWEQVFNKDDIQIFRKFTEGSKYCTVKGVTVVDTHLSVIAQVLKDVELAGQWFENVDHIRIVNQIDSYNLTLYIALDLPWPISNRDMVLDGSGRFHDPTGRLLVKLSAKENSSIPIKENYIRMTDAKSDWILECFIRDKNKTRVIYQAKMDPAGFIPAFIININVKKHVRRTLIGLKKTVTNTKYIEAAKNSRFNESVERVFRDTAYTNKVIEARKKQMVFDSDG